MTFNIARLEKKARKIQIMVKSGELVDGCCMSAVQTPAREAWDIAEELTEGAVLSVDQRQAIFTKLDKEIQLQLASTDYDDFDLVYERLLQLICDAV